MYPDRKERDNVEPDLRMSISIESAEVELGLSQSTVNKEIPDGLTGYDVRVIEIQNRIAPD